MNILYTGYGFKGGEPTKNRPCGMSTLVYFDKKSPSANQQAMSCILAKLRKYDVVVFYRDDECIRTIELQNYHG